ncbi:MAG: hypothetical protein LBT21_03235 [Oscillospiraceae bacterium]|nr:hypothetical protein [Oscillospiraceae bacterium]
MQKYKTPLVCAACLAYAALLLSHPELGTAALRDGLFLCAERLIPSLLPFLFLAGFLLRSGAAALIGKLFAPLTRQLFRLPAICAPVVLMALSGGYPVGLSLAASLVRSGQIPAAAARRMTRFCLGAGPAFVVLGVGQSLLGSSRAGWILFTALIVSALLIGLLLPQGISMPSRTHIPPHGNESGATSLGGALSESIESAARQMLNICVWTLLFGTLCAYLPLFVHNEYAYPAACALLEVAAGSQSAASLGSLPLIAAALAWGGLCVHCQILGPLKVCGQSLPRFWFWRMVHAGLAALICRALLLIFPATLPDLALSVSAMPSAQLWQFSTPAALGLAAMGAGVLYSGFRREVFTNE